MCLYKINYTKQPNDENHIEIVNVSNTTINNLKLLVDISLSNIAECTVVRERGRLAFTPPISLIELGNLSPNESAHFYYTLRTATSIPDSDRVLQQFQLAYDESNSENILSSNIVSSLLDEEPSTLDQTSSASDVEPSTLDQTSSASDVEPSVLDEASSISDKASFTLNEALSTEASSIEE